MNKQRELLDKILNPRPVVQVWQAEVLSANTTACEVKILATGVTDTALLCADSEAERVWVAVPKVGSVVLVGAIQNEVSDLYVVQISEVERVCFKLDKVSGLWDKNGFVFLNDQSKVEVKSNGVTVDVGQTSVELSGGKVSIKNAGVDLKGILDDLVGTLNTFIVITAQGPSTAVSPTSLARLTAIQTKINSLLK